MLRKKPCKSAQLFWEMMDTRVDRMKRVREQLDKVPYPDGVAEEDGKTLDELHAAVQDAIEALEDVDLAEVRLEALEAAIVEAKKKIDEGEPT